MYTLSDYGCDCGNIEEHLAEPNENVRCTKCGLLMARILGAPHIFTTIVPTTRTSKRLKAGYVHKYANRPATKTQVGYGGGVSKKD